MVAFFIGVISMLIFGESKKVPRPLCKASVSKTEECQKVLVSIPTYNEKGNIEPLYTALKKLPFQIDILFIDDNSPDGTGTIIDELIAQDNHVHVIHRAQKLGLGTAHLAGFNYARENKYTHVITMDADLLHDPKYIPDLLSKSRHADIVIGSRYVKGGTYDGVSGIRKFFTHFWRLCIKLGLGLNCDATGSYRLYRVAILKPTVLDKIQATGFEFNLEALYRFKKAGAKIAEIPIQTHGRSYGTTKLTAKDQHMVWGNFCSLLWDRIRG